MTVRISTASGSERGFPRESRSLPLAVLIQSDFPYMQLQSALASRGGPVCETVFPLVVCQADQLPILQPEGVQLSVNLRAEHDRLEERFFIIDAALLGSENYPFSIGRILRVSILSLRPG